MSTKVALDASEETIGLGALGVRFLLTGHDTNGAMSVFEMIVASGVKIPAPAHKNDAYEETIYGVTGVITWTVDGTPFAVGPGQALCIPRGAVHRFENRGDTEAKQLVVISPAIMTPAYFHDVAETLHAAAGKPPDPATMAAIFRRHGMTIAAPPPTVP
jgi:quercetin dioxygenase-like cupin family protein